MEKVNIEFKTENVKDLINYLGEVLDGTGDSFKIKKNNKFYHKQPCDCDICFNQKQILK